MRAEDWIKSKWPARIKGDDIIVDEGELKVKEMRPDPTTGEMKEVEISLGTMRQSCPITHLADMFRGVIEDDETYPEKRKKKDGLRAANINPDGSLKIPVEIWDRLLKEALG